jgi:vacuole morphology and inheritance protein 14
MVQHLNVQLLTAPMLLDFRKRFKSLDSKDGQGLFVSLYRAWSHNAVATLALCFLAQVYEHTYALLQSLCVFASDTEYC